MFNPYLTETLIVTRDNAKLRISNKSMYLVKTVRADSIQPVIISYRYFVCDDLYEFKYIVYERDEFIVVKRSLVKVEQILKVQLISS